MVRSKPCADGYVIQTQSRAYFFCFFQEIYLFGNSMRSLLFTPLCASRASRFSRSLQPNYFLCRSNILICSPVLRYLRRTAIQFCARDYQLAKWRGNFGCCVASTFAVSTASICSLGWIDLIHGVLVGALVILYLITKTL